MNQIPSKKIVILISGNGSNLQAFIDRQNTEQLNGKIVAVISNVANVYGLIRAKKSQIPAITIDHKRFDSRSAFDSALVAKIDEFAPDLVVLAGFMRILTDAFVSHYQGHLLNIHPSLLPKYPGLHTHRRAIENHEKYHGASVHFVTAELDAGSVIAQSKHTILSDDNEQSLKTRVQSLEHQLYPATANLLLTGKIKLVKGIIYMGKSVLQTPLLL